MTDPIMDRLSQPLLVETLCYRCIHKPSTGGSSLDGRLMRGYLMEHELCGGCDRQGFCCQFRPAVRCTGCGNVIQVEPSECRNDACANVYCIVCALAWLPKDAAGLCVSCGSGWRHQHAAYQRLMAAFEESLRRSE